MSNTFARKIRYVVVVAFILLACSFQAQDKTVRFSTKIEKGGKPCGGAHVTISQNGKPFQTIVTNDDGRVKVELPLGFNYEISIGKAQLCTKKIEVSTVGVPTDGSNYSFEIAAITLFELQKGIDYSVLNQVLVKAAYSSSMKNIDYDENYVNQMLGALEKLKQLEKEAILKEKEKEANYQGAIKNGDKSFQKKEWQASLSFYEQASTIKPDENYPKDQIAHIKKLIAEADTKSKADAEAAAKKKAEEEAARLAAEKAAKEKAEAEAKAKAEAEAAAAKKKAEEEAARLAAEKAAKEKADAEAKAKAEADAKAKAEAEAAAKKKAEEEAARLAAEKAAKEKADNDAKAKADAEAKAKAEAEAKKKAEEEAARLAAEKAAKEKADAEAKAKAETDAKKKAEEEVARLAAEKAAKEKTDAEAKAKAEADAKKKAEEEVARLAAEKAAKEKADAEAKAKAETDAKKKAEEEVARLAAEKAAKEKADAEAKAKAETDAKAKAEADAKKKAEEEAARVAAEKAAKEKADAEANEKADLEAKKKAEEAARLAAEKDAKDKADAEAALAKAKAAEEAKAKAEAEAKKKAEEAAAAKALAETESRYKLLIANGDKFFNKKEYDKSRELFVQATELRPNEKYPKDKVAEIDKLLKELAKQKEIKDKNTNTTLPVLGKKTETVDVNAKYTEAIKQADGFFNDKKYKDAKKYYQEALTHKGGDAYAKIRMTECEKFINADNAQIVNQRKKELLSKYKPGVTEETITGSNVVILQRILVKDGDVWVYQKKMFKWGGISFFRDEVPITESIFEQETAK